MTFGGLASLLLIVPIALRGTVMPSTGPGWLLPVAGLLLLYLAIKTLALWRLARRVFAESTGDEPILAMCSGRSAGLRGFLGKGWVVAATTGGLLTSRTQWRVDGYARLPYSELLTWQVDGLNEARPSLTLMGAGLNLRLVALNPKCARLLERTVQSRRFP